jgi:hypothetical protein
VQAAPAVASVGTTLISVEVEVGTMVTAQGSLITIKTELHSLLVRKARQASRISVVKSGLISDMPQLITRSRGTRLDKNINTANMQISAIKDKILLIIFVRAPWYIRYHAC